MYFVKRALCLLAGLALLGLAVSPAQAARKPIRIGAIYIMSGVAATYGEFAKDGIDMAVDEINDAGGILGRPVEVLLEDSQIKADVAIQAARKLVYQDEVDALMGLDSSGVARGVAPVIPELQKPFIITHAATPDVTGNLCNRYTFRISVNIAQNIKAAATIAKQEGGKRWTTIGPDYAFGHQVWEFFQQYLTELDPSTQFMSDTAFPRFGAEDFTPFINKVMASKPDGVIVSLWGGDLVNFVRQASNLGFFDQDFHVQLILGAATEVLTALGDKMPEGIWVGTRYWFLANDSPMNKRFVKNYHQRFGKYPSYNAQNAYAALYVYKKAFEKAGSTDPEKVIAALSGMQIELPMGKITIRTQDHQALIGPTWGVTKASADYDIRILDPMRTFSGDEVTPRVAETGCDLGM